MNVGLLRPGWTTLASQENHGFQKTQTCPFLNPTTVTLCKKAMLRRYLVQLQDTFLSCVADERSWSYRWEQNAVHPLRSNWR